MPSDHRRIVVQGVTPEVDGGRYPAKRAVGEPVVVEADIFSDNHEALAADLLYKRDGDETWTRTPMSALVNDRWRAPFTCEEMTPYVFSIEAWIDPFARWRDGLARKAEAGQDVASELLTGEQLIADAATRASAKDAQTLRSIAAKLYGQTPLPDRINAALDEGLALRMRDLADRRTAVRYERELRVKVDPLDAMFSSWYEMFPRSASAEPARAGTLRDVEERLGYVAEMGFDVLYLPPIHPIGTTPSQGAEQPD